MILFILPILAAAQFQSAHPTICSHFTNATDVCEPLDSLCFYVDLATQQCVNNVVVSLGGPAGMDAVGITNNYASVGLTNAHFATAYFMCSFMMTSNLTSPIQNKIHSGLRSMYECDAVASGIPSVSLFTTVWDAQGMCMSDPACVSAYSDLRAHKLVKKQETSFTYNQITQWYDIAPTNDNDQMCACVFASLEIGNTNLVQYLVTGTYALNLNGVDPDQIVQHCYDSMNKQVMTLLFIVIPVTLVLTALVVGGFMFWWFTGCSCSESARKEPYKVEGDAQL